VDVISRHAFEIQAQSIAVCLFLGKLAYIPLSGQKEKALISQGSLDCLN
jgi:hypothetical protein